jgi:hypothetical protein
VEDQRQQVQLAGGTRRNGLGRVTGNLGHLDEKSKKRGQRPGTKRPKDTGLDVFGRPRGRWLVQGHTPAERQSHRAVFAAFLRTLTREEQFIYECQYGSRRDDSGDEPKALTLEVISEVSGMSLSQVKRLSASMAKRRRTLGLGEESELPERLCEACGHVPLEPHQRRYCSERCRQRAKKRRARARPVPPLTEPSGPKNERTSDAEAAVPNR